MFDLTFTVDDKGAPTPLTLPIDQAVIAGWTGRDPVARDKHIAELEAIGIARPATTPIYYRVSARRLTMADSSRSAARFQRRGRVRADRLARPHLRRLRLRSHRPQGRGLQRHGLKADVRQAGRPELWELEDVIGHWDQMILRSHAWIDGARVLYQEGTLDGMLPVQELIARGFGRKGLPMAARCSAAPLLQGRHSPGEPVRVRTGRSRAKAHHPPWL